MTVTRLLRDYKMKHVQKLATECIRRVSNATRLYTMENQILLRALILWFISCAWLCWSPNARELQGKAHLP